MLLKQRCWGRLFPSGSVADPCPLELVNTCARQGVGLTCCIAETYSLNSLHELTCMFLSSFQIRHVVQDPKVSYGMKCDHLPHWVLEGSDALICLCIVKVLTVQVVQCNIYCSGGTYSNTLTLMCLFFDVMMI